jgi:cell wall-associated NlpC family hydrolase
MPMSARAFSTSSRSRADRRRGLASTTLISAAAAAALIGLPATASAATPSQQTIDDAPSRVEADSTVTFSGTLTGYGDRPLAGESVDLERKAESADSWSVADSALTDEDGRVSIPATITDSADWRLSYAGDTLRDGDNSEPVHVESQDAVNERIVDKAEEQEGKPYSYGSAGPDSFDCSGLTQYVHREVGIDIPRTSSDQRAATAEVAKSDKQPGDLVFFHDGGSVYHVGIYAGDNEIWHAPQSGDTVHKRAIWTDSYTVGRAW